MEHTKKMVLLPEESIERLKTLITNNELKSVQTPGTVSSRLDAEMNDILNSSICKDEREKWQRYQQVLQRYLHFKGSDAFVQQRSKNSNLSGFDSQSLTEQFQDETEGEEDEDMLKEIDRGIVNHVPEKFRSAGGKLLEWLRTAGNVTWDANGAVNIDGARIRGANVIDLLNDALRDRKRDAPVGHHQFAIALRRASVPQEFVGNKRVWRNAIVGSSSSASSPSEYEIANTPRSHKQNTSDVSGVSDFEQKQEGSGPTPTRRKKKLVTSSALHLQSWRRLSGNSKSKRKKH